MNTLSIRSVLLHVFSVMMVIMSFALISCSSETNDPIYVVQEWATYTGSIAGKPMFEVQRTGNAPVYTLIGDRGLGDSGLQIGARVLLSYEIRSIEALPTEGEITLTGCARVLTYTPKVVDMDTVPDWDAHALYIEYAARTGGYINIMSRAYINASDLASTFTFYVDYASLSTSTPRLYLRYNRPLNSFDMGRVPMSLDVRTLWSQTERFDGVVLNVKNDNLESLSVFDFPRSAENYVQP